MIVQAPSQVYLAGPMTGFAQFNFPAFDAATADLRERGWSIVSPSELDDPETRDAALASADGAPGSGSTNGETWEDFLSRDVVIVANPRTAGCIVLPGWEKSRGARFETHTAHRLGKWVVAYDPEGVDGVRELTAGESALLERSAPDPDLDYAYATEGYQLHVGGEVDPEQLAERLRFEVGSRPAILPGGEVRVVNETTGGEKGSKSQRMDLLPWDVLMRDVAPLYAAGAAKYADHNWRRGYAWSLSAGALGRHFAAFWHGEDDDPELGTPHLASVVFHALALLHFSAHYPDLDDRPPVGRVEPEAVAS